MTDLWHAGSAMTATPRLPGVLAPFARRRTWNELLYSLAGLPAGIACFVFSVVTLSVGGALVVVFVGLPIIAISGSTARQLGAGFRRSSQTLTGVAVPAPPPLHPRPGLFGWIGSSLLDVTAWRAQLYLILKLPLGITSFGVAVTFYATGVGGVSYPIWRPFLPCQNGRDGQCHVGASLGPYYFLDTPFRIGLGVVIGVLVLLAAPWAVRSALKLDHWAVRALLGATQSQLRVEQLTRTRTTAIDDSAATLRRIERDLHDGAQARMVSVAMTIGLAREKLAEGADPAEASRLLDTAHTSAKEAVGELRDLARGIHPPVLDTGLASALQTLAAHSAVPVELHTTIAGRQDPAIETMAYFCVAELLANVAKHSEATQAWINAGTAGPWLRVAVSDDGRGGARTAPGSGLAGLADRVATVDGTLTVDSPPGGPTTVSIDVPLTSGRSA
ncbi:MAG: sensor domain-containing protein [Jatrophihabitans sp.]